MFAEVQSTSRRLSGRWLMRSKANGWLKCIERGGNLSKTGKEKVHNQRGTPNSRALPLLSTDSLSVFLKKPI